MSRITLVVSVAYTLRLSSDAPGHNRCVGLTAAIQRVQSGDYRQVFTRGQMLVTQLTL